MSANDLESGDRLFDIMTPLGIMVHTTHQYWDYIIRIKHPVLRDELESVIQTLKFPDQIRQSRSDENIFLFYRGVHEKRWVCAVVKNEDGSGFLVSAYPSDKIKKGRLIWTK